MLSNRKQINNLIDKYIHFLHSLQRAIILCYIRQESRTGGVFFVDQRNAGATARNGESPQPNVTSNATRKPTPLCCTCNACSLGSTYQGYSIDLSRLLYRVSESFTRKHSTRESSTRKTAATNFNYTLHDLQKLTSFSHTQVHALALHCMASQAKCTLL